MSLLGVGQVPPRGFCCGYSLAGESDIPCFFRHFLDDNDELRGVISLESVAWRGLVGCTPDQSSGRKKQHHKNVFKHDFHWAGRKCLTWGSEVQRHRRRGKARAQYFTICADDEMTISGRPL